MILHVPCNLGGIRHADPAVGGGSPIVLGSGLYLWLVRGRNSSGRQGEAFANRRASGASADNGRPNAQRRTHEHVWRVPLIVALITLIGLIAALVGDDRYDALSWAALAVPVALVVWGWSRR